MVGISQRCESLDAIPAAPVVVPAAAGTDVLPDRTTDGTNVAYRYIQNLTGANLWYCIADTADAAAGQNNYHGRLADGDQLSVPTKRRVSVWSLAGGIVAVLELVKKDL